MPLIQYGRYVYKCTCHVENKKKIILTNRYRTPELVYVQTFNTVTGNLLRLCPSINRCQYY